MKPIQQRFKSLKSLTAAALTTTFLVPSVVFAEDATSEAVPGELPNGKISVTKLIPPVTRVFEYSGDLKTRSTLLGDFGGKRTELYNKGLSLDATYTQVLQSVRSGGPKDSSDRAAYSGLFELNAAIDTAKAGWWSGGLLNFTMMTSAGNPLTEEAGNLSPLNGTVMWPVPFTRTTELSEYYLLQGLPNDFSLVVGRLDATNFLDKSSYANNPESQFLNISLNNNLLWGEFLSFSTYAALLEKKVNKDLTIAVAAWDPETQPGDYGGVWDNYGVAVTAILDYEINGLKGVFNPVLAYSSKDTTAFDNPYFIPDLIESNVKLKNDNWMFTITGEQALWTPPGSSTPRAQGGTKEDYFVPTQDFVTNEPGVGLFYRFAYTPEDRNPWNIFMSGGVGARGIIPNRPYDRMGLGFYHMKESDDLKDIPIIKEIVQSETGVEAFYNYAITPSIQLSGSVQYVDSGIRGVDDAWILGGRLFIRF